MKLTPAMKQYMEVKAEYEDAIVLFRMGDFYECFYDDAKAVSNILGIALTSRGKDESKAPLAGIPHHALDKYIKTLVDKGKKVAIVEQIEDPKKAKGIVKRAVTRVITPGTVIEDSILDEGANNYIISLFFDGNQAGICACDISTGEFFIHETTKKQIIDEIARFSPSEILVAQSDEKITQYTQANNIYTHALPLHYFAYEHSKKKILEQFGKEITDMELAMCAAGSLLRYFADTQKTQLKSLTSIQKIKVQECMEVDEATLRNLELIQSLFVKQSKDTLLHTVDKTYTSMGSRLLKQWILRPLYNRVEIEKRLFAVETLIDEPQLLSEIISFLKLICDIERIITRISLGTSGPRDVLTLKQSLEVLPTLSSKLQSTQSQLLQQCSQFATKELHTLIDTVLKDDVPFSAREGNFIKKGYDKELDEQWELKTNARQILARIEKEEIEKTGIQTLKIKYNKVFGYFIEITKRFSDKVPEYYQRKQSTVNAERFITPQLKELEEKILSAEEHIHQKEYELFVELCKNIADKTDLLQKVARKVATVDCLCSFAQISQENNYCKPAFHDQYESYIVNGRHPVIELQERQFVPNTCTLSQNAFMMIITGPNMAGKSTFMRQVALIHIMAQMGCYVPAKKAKLPLVDKVFTRVGAHDNLSKGQSTFMVEMSETAYILQHASQKSLIILDEIGSGTSTYDGVAIAWAVAQHIAQHIKAKTLFSTHYHVLTKLEQISGIVNYNVAVDEKQDTITFLRKIIPGGTDKSYGIHVAKLAGIPDSVIENAKKTQIRLTKEDAITEKVVVEKQEQLFAKLKQKTLMDLE